MSSALRDVWGGSLNPTKCKTSTLLEYLDRRDLLGYGLPSDYDDLDLLDQLAHLRGRDGDRLRVLKFIASHPEGVFQTHITSYVCKGVRPDSCERIDGSDADYQFVRRFVQDLRENTSLVRTDRFEGGRMVSPTLELLDLISEGITETTTSDDSLVYDRDFLLNILRTTNDLSDGHRDLAESALSRYINRVNSYRLLFNVTADNGFRSGDRMMTKNYKTRFNDRGRISKMFARYNQALETMVSEADNAVLVTLTSDPGTTDDPDRPDPRSLLELTDSINPNFHRLTQYFKSDPATKSDTRDPGVVSYRTELADEVTGRPRKKLDYIKALEFTERGLPHLHILFFDVPTRRDGGDLDGMPWLIDKQELVDKWSDYGQGQIVDVYPLVKRDDLDDLDTQFAKDSGFVCWYRYGEHGLSQERAEQLSRSHRIDMAGDADNPMQKTAGQYLGKYLSMTFAALLEESGHNLEEFDDSYSDKISAWKLALYWATGKQFWSISRRLEEKIDRNDQLDDDLLRAVRWASKHDVQIACEKLGVASFVPDDLDGQRNRSAVSQLVSSPYVNIDYLGAYHYSEIPAYIDLSNRASLEPVEKAAVDPDEPLLLSRGDRPPPLADVWGV